MSHLFASPLSETRPRPAGQKPVHNLTTEPKECIRVGIIGCQRGVTHAVECARIEFADVVALCDLRLDRAEAVADRMVREFGRPRPDTYGGSESSWEALVDRDDIDAVYVASPWDLHLPMAVRAMESGKHAFVEVSAVTTVEECWQLVDASERAQRHCVLLENCCYGEDELFVTNLVANGVLGELTHAECAYIHDLRAIFYDLDSEGAWRRRYHTLADGNHYATHGLGPVANYMDLGRGDQFTYLVSMSSPERSLSRYRDRHNPNEGRHAAEKYVCGDMNTSLLKTVSGRSIVLEYDVVSPRPYSRGNLVSGTGGIFQGYPSRLALDEPGLFGLEATSSHDWLGEADMALMRERFTHPLWAQLREKAVGAGHGGMDFVMNYRLLDCLRRGVTPDSVVYDAAAWSCLQELSALSVANGSMPVGIPDFTRGAWKELGKHALKGGGE